MPGPRASGRSPNCAFAVASPMIPTLLYSLSGGMLAVLATGRTEEIAWKFLRMIGLVTFALPCGVTVWTMTQPAAASVSGVAALWLGVATTLAAMGLVFLAPFANRRCGLFRTLCLIGGLAGLAACSLSSLAMLTPAANGIVTTVMVVVSQTLGGWLLGSITVAWLLGHAYLTATKMTIAPLRHFSRLLSWSIIARIAFTLVSVAIAWSIGSDAPPSVIARLEASWLILSLRVGVGLIGVGAFAYMVSDCVRLRSTQSATGILYFGSVFAIVGELACQQLITECGWPI